MFDLMQLYPARLDLQGNRAGRRFSPMAGDAPALQVNNDLLEPVRKCVGLQF